MTLPCDQSDVCPVQAWPHFRQRLEKADRLWTTAHSCRVQTALWSVTYEEESLTVVHTAAVLVPLPSQHCQETAVNPLGTHNAKTSSTSFKPH